MTINSCNGRHRYSEVLIYLGLVLVTLMVYWQVQYSGFVGLDDDRFITENPKVSAGLTLDGIAWAFSFNDAEYWLPLTWLSHMLDSELYGLNPRGHHLNNLLFHIANALLLFSVLKRLTGAHWQSAAVAALFAFHPLNVESVAWVASRKNVLSTFFWMLTLWTYAFYAERPGYGRYLMVFLCLAFGLMAKPMLATLPLMLLLLDFWPLGRLRSSSLITQSLPDAQPTRPSLAGIGAYWLILEKLPFLALSAASSYISLLSSQSRGTVVPAETVTVVLRIENAFVSYLTYIAKMIWPSDLAVFYPYPYSLPKWQSVSSAFLILFMTSLVIRRTLRDPFLFVGWFWYIITLAPVIGIIQQGLWPAWADRFAYIPLIGPFIIIAWGLNSIFAKHHLPKVILSLVSVILISALGVFSWKQLSYWNNSEMLFERAIHVTSGNHLAHYNLGGLLISQGKSAEAILHYKEALRIMPANPLFHHALGMAFLSQGKTEEAMESLREALRWNPHYAEAHINLGHALAKDDHIDEAIIHLSEALRIKPVAEAHHNLGLIFAGQGRFTEAVSHYYEALQIKPNDAKVHNDLGVALCSQGRYQEAISHLSRALSINPGDARIRHNLNVVLERLDRTGQMETSGKIP